MKTKRNPIQMCLLCAALLAGVHTASARQQIPDACWSGTWSGIYSYPRSSGECEWTDTGNLTLNLSVINGVVSGSGSLDGVQCVNLNSCETSIDLSFSGSLAGTVSGTTISLSGCLPSTGGSCGSGGAVVGVFRLWGL